MSKEVIRKLDSAIGMSLLDDASLELSEFAKGMTYAWLLLGRAEAGESLDVDPRTVDYKAAYMNGWAGDGALS